MPIITKEELAELTELLTEAEDLRPVVNLIIKTLKSFGPELAEIPELLSVWITKNRIRTIKQYEDAGFSREDAITMTLDEAFAVGRLARKASIAYSKK